MVMGDPASEISWYPNACRSEEQRDRFDICFAVAIDRYARGGSGAVIVATRLLYADPEVPMMSGDDDAALLAEALVVARERIRSWHAGTWRA